MNVKIACVGKLKERFYRDAEAEFLKRLSRYAAVEVAEVADEKAPEQLSAAERERVKHAEGQRLLGRVAPGDWVVAMDPGGEQLSSEEFAARLGQRMGEGKSRIVFLIGGSLGLSGEALGRADARLSFGRPTFPHQLFRVMLLEQVYRAFRILGNEPYHK